MEQATRQRASVAQRGVSLAAAEQECGESTTKRRTDGKGIDMKKQALGLALSTGVLLLGAATAVAQDTYGKKPATTSTTTKTETSDTMKTSDKNKTTTTAGSSLPAKDTRFIKNVAKAGMNEVDMGRLGADKAASSEVKQFAQKMVDDHGKANSELTSLAGSKNVQLPEHKDMSNKLADKSGADFDKAFMKQMVADHKKVVRELESEAKSGKDPDVKAFAEKTLPTVKGHLDEAQNIYNGLKGTSTTTTGTRSTTKTGS
jgi:putative membrane protein